MGTALSNLYEFTMGELPDCPKPLLMRNIVLAVREWCMRSQAWEIDLDDIDIIADQDTYQLDSPVEDTEVIACVNRPSDDVGVKWDGRLLSPGVEYTIEVTKNMLTLDETPSAASTGGLTVRVAIAPILSATEDMEVPDRLFSDNQDIWAKGAMSRLMLMPKKEWTDIDTARTYHAMFWDGIRLAIAERTRGRTNRDIRVQIPFFA